MTPDPLTVQADDAMAHCAALLEDRPLRHLLVVGSAGEALGVLTDFAVAQQGTLLEGQPRLWVPFDLAAADATAGDLAKAAPRLPVDTPIAAALARMLEDHSELVVAVDEAGRPLGVLTEHDVTRRAAELLPDELLAGDLASRPVLRVGLDARAESAWEVLRSHGVRHLAVVDGPRVVGVVSWRDLVADDVPRGRQLPIRHVLRRQDPVTCSAESSAPAAARLMERHRVGCLPTLDALGELVGILTRSDLVRAIANLSSPRT